MKHWIWYIVITIVFAFAYGGYYKSSEHAGKSTGQDATEQFEGTSDKETTMNDKAAMENSPHLKFKGVPIDGTLQKFVSRMKGEGFAYVGDTEGGSSVLEGDFAAYVGCRIYVSTLMNKDLVSQITVVFPKQDQWRNLYGNYKNLKEMLTEKYGKPASCTERFQDSVYADDDSSRMLGVSLNVCQYITRFQADNGEITLSIEHGKFSTCYVKLTYKDAVNSRAVRQHAMEDL